MKNWITAYGVHIATASKTGFPTVIVADTVSADGSTVGVRLSPSQAKQIASNILENPQVALAPGQLGSVRAPYQFKGKARLTGELLEIEVNEIYCTKPGAEAGIRLDTLGYDGMKAYEESRWTDLAPVK
jgi:hypothetical protein